MISMLIGGRHRMAAAAFFAYFYIKLRQVGLLSHAVRVCDLCIYLIRFEN